jgi:pimeloyl-ACP methyl ester carboxylesterase
MDSPAPRYRRILRRVAVFSFIPFLLFGAVSCYYAYHLTGPRNHAVGRPPADFPFLVEDVAWQTADEQRIRGWFLPAEGSDRAIVLLHGYGGDRRSMLPRAKFFRQQGYNVLLYDARACGESSGAVCTMGYHETKDLEAALDFLRTKEMRRPACLGVSQGGATIVMAAEKIPDVRCVICESVYDELSHAVDRRFRHYFGIPGWVGGCVVIPIAEYRTGVALDEVKPARLIGKLPCPVFIISGEEDTKTWREDTQRLFDAAHEPKALWIIPGAGHSDLFGSEYQPKVLAFLDRYMR